MEAGIQAKVYQDMGCQHLLDKKKIQNLANGCLVYVISAKATGRDKSFICFYGSRKILFSILVVSTELSLGSISSFITIISIIEKKKEFLLIIKL